MIEEAAQLEKFHPLSYGTPMEHDYIRTLWEVFDTNVEHDKYQFAFLAYHMLLMSFVYFKIWQIRLIRKHDFRNALVGFKDETQREFHKASSPFVFSMENESKIFDFFRLIKCDRKMIRAYKELVRKRNDAAHANGNVFFSTEGALATDVHNVLCKVKEIQCQSAPIIGEGYKTFLIESQDPNSRPSTDDAEQIKEVLVKEFYMSVSDIAFCRNYDIGELAGEAGFSAIQTLHQKLADLYPSEEETI